MKRPLLFHKDLRRICTHTNIGSHLSIVHVFLSLGIFVGIPPSVPVFSVLCFFASLLFLLLRFSVDFCLSAFLPFCFFCFSAFCFYVFCFYASLFLCFFASLFFCFSVFSLFLLIALFASQFFVFYSLRCCFAGFQVQL